MDQQRHNKADDVSNLPVPEPIPAPCCILLASTGATIPVAAAPNPAPLDQP